jgi:hypothetical protein
LFSSTSEDRSVLCFCIVSLAVAELPMQQSSSSAWWTRPKY